MSKREAGVEESRTWHALDDVSGGGGLTFTRTSLGVVKVEREARGAGNPGFVVMLGPWEWAQVVKVMDGTEQQFLPDTSFGESAPAKPKLRIGRFATFGDGAWKCEGCGETLRMADAFFPECGCTRRRDPAPEDTLMRLWPSIEEQRARWRRENEERAARRREAALWETA